MPIPLAIVTLPVIFVIWPLLYPNVQSPCVGENILSIMSRRKPGKRLARTMSVLAWTTSTTGREANRNGDVPFSGKCSANHDWP